MARGVREAQATHIFDLMEKFAGYGFNKSHSAAYALLSYQTAWLKAHYPAAFMAAVLSSDMDKTDKVVTLIDECASMGLDRAAARMSTGRCTRSRSPEPASIRYGLGAIKGVGESAVRGASSTSARRSGPFLSLPDLCRRIDLQRINRRVLEALVRSGSLDSHRPESRDAERGARARDAPRRAEFARGQHRAGGPVRPERRAGDAGERASRSGPDAAAPRRRARDARAVPERPSDHPVRAGLEVAGQRATRRRRRPEARGAAEGERGWAGAQAGDGRGSGAGDPPPRRTASR